MPKRLSKIDPLDIDELFESPSLKGMLSFRDVDPEMATVRFKAKTVLDSRLDPPPIGTKPIRRTTKQAVSPQPGCESSPNESQLTTGEIAPPGRSGQTDSVHITADLSTADILSGVHDTSRSLRTRGNIMRATKVEDAHSGNENSLYWYLWRAGREIRNSRSHYIQIGYAFISRAVGLDRTNVQNILRSLEAKLSIRVVTPGTVKSSTVYEVFSCEQILARRRDLGFLWVRRYGSRRVDFVDDLGNLLPPVGAAPTGAASRVGVTPPPGIGVGLPVPVGTTPTHLVSSNSSQQTTPAAEDERAISTETQVSVIHKAISQYVTPDDDGIQAIIRDVRRVVPDAKPEEIVYFIHAKGMVVRTGKIHNPMGFFIMTIPICFKGTTFQEFRREQARQLAQAEEQARQAETQLEVFYKEQERISQDPNASDDDKAFASRMLIGRDRSFQN